MALDQGGKPGRTGLARVWAATRYSWLGLKAAYRHEAAFRQELWVSVVLAALAVLLADTFGHFVALTAPLVIVLVVELVNSAIESIVDRVSPDHHELSGRAKDMGSAAVFVSVCFAAVVWAVYVGGVLLQWTFK